MYLFLSFCPDLLFCFPPQWAILTRSGASTARMSRHWVSTRWPWRISQTTTGPKPARERDALNGVAGTTLIAIGLRRLRNVFQSPWNLSHLNLEWQASLTFTVKMSVMFGFHFHSVCQEYFLDGGMKRMLEKDEKSATLAMGLTAASVSAQPYSTIPR